MNLSPIRFVLVDTSHPGNIGAVARAMKNMGLSDLALVNPREFPHPEATARASGADDLLDRARVCATLEEAIADSGLVLATTARAREQHFRVLEAREAAGRIVAESRAGGGAVAVVFGTERFGLSNEHLLKAHALLRIPANPEYESLNIGMAAQLIAYEIRLAARTAQPAPVRDTPLATPEQMERFYVHLEQVMSESNFRDRTRSGTHLMGRIRRMFNRAELDANEVNILRGILTAVQFKRRRAGEGQAGEVSSCNEPQNPTQP
ncbi:MAG: RNA methyltransferase [Nevskiaceae bacterium]|jgi:TrmH family RNA methyltransferase|nr:RNA methyltransferase [Nevskiaceae bacterium]